LFTPIKSLGLSLSAGTSPIMGKNTVCLDDVLMTAHFELGVVDVF
jgi:hypothetical protein